MIELTRDEAILLYLSRPMRATDIPRAWRDQLLNQFGLHPNEAGEAMLQEKLDDINERLHKALNKGGDPDV